MKYQKLCAVLSTAYILLGAHTSSAAITIYQPDAFSANSSFATNYSESNLFDATVTEATLDVAVGMTDSETSPILGRAWAVAQLAGPGVLVLDFSTPLTFDGLLYAQRSFANASADDFGLVDVWVTNTAPGAATLTLPSTLGAANASLTLTQNEGAILRRYDFTAAETGRYVVLSFTAGEIFSGGHELRLFAVPEPTTFALLLSLGMIPLASRRRHASA
jgi:hypothetical protein